MPTIQQVLSGRHAILRDTPATYAEDLQRVLDALAKSLDRLLKDFDRADGALVARPASIRLATNMFPELVRALDEAGYARAAEKYLARYGDVIAAVRETFNVSRIPAAFTTVHANAAQVARAIDFTMFEAIGESAMREIQRSIAQSVLYERPYRELVFALTEKITGSDVRGAPLANRANTFARTAIAQFDALVTKMIGDEARVELYEYWGPMDNITRPWCQERLDAAEQLSIDDINALESSESNPDEDNFIGRGGYNCRHIWQPVPLDELPR